MKAEDRLKVQVKQASVILYWYIQTNFLIFYCFILFIFFEMTTCWVTVLSSLPQVCAIFWYIPKYDIESWREKSSQNSEIIN